MKQGIGNRIAILRKSLGDGKPLNQIQFAEKLGLSNGFISAIELGKAPLTEANIRLVCLTYNVNEEWLRYGTGKMLNEATRLLEME